MVMLLCPEMPMTTLVDTLRGLDAALWRVGADSIEATHAKRFWAKVRQISLDQTSSGGPSLCHQCACFSAMVKAVENMSRINDLHVLDGVEDTSQGSRGYGFDHFSARQMVGSLVIQGSDAGIVDFDAR
jgi:hypothetical protein